MNGTLPLFPEGRPVSNGPASADEEHARRIVDALSAGLASSEEVFEAFAALDALDSEAVLSALRPWTGEASDPESLDDDLRRAHGFPPRRPRLRLHAIIRDADVLDLGSIAEEQLRVAGRIYDGSDLSAEDRLDGEVEGSFAGTLELRIVADESGTPLFDVYFFAGDAGVIFRAGTTELVGGINYGAVEMKDRALREAVTAALREEFVPPRVAAGPSDAGAPEKVAPAKKAAAKKVAAKKVAAKAEKPAAKKVAAKPEKPVAKKVAAKKVAAETEKPAAKKVAAKKASTKKSKAAAEAAPAKKASAKKVAAKAEKPVAKSAPKKASTNPAASKKATTKTPAKAASAPAKKATTKKASSPVKKVAKSKAGAKASAKKSATKK